MCIRDRNRSMIRLDGLLTMVNDLLDISRMEMQTVHREIKRVCVHEVIASILELFQIDINKKGIHVIFDQDEYRQCIKACLLYTSDAADERSRVDLGGRRTIKKKNRTETYSQARN